MDVHPMTECGSLIRPLDDTHMVTVTSYDLTDIYIGRKE
jgi:hypothetical protein